MDFHSSCLTETGQQTLTYPTGGPIRKTYSLRHRRPAQHLLTCPACRVIFPEHATRNCVLDAR